MYVYFTKTKQGYLASKTNRSTYFFSKTKKKTKHKRSNNKIIFIMTNMKQETRREQQL